MRRRNVPQTAANVEKLGVTAMISVVIQTVGNNVKTCTKAMMMKAMMTMMMMMMMMMMIRQMVDFDIFLWTQRHENEDLGTMLLTFETLS